MSDDKPASGKKENKFRISNLIDDNRFFRYSLVILAGIGIVILAVIFRGITKPQIMDSAQTPQFAPTNDQMTTKEPPAATVTGEPGTITPIPTPSDNAFSQALLSTEDLNAIIDIWSPENTEIKNYSQKEYNLTDAAGRSYVSKSGDYRLSIEIYHFSIDSEMAFKVSNALKGLYLQKMGYMDTNMACRVAVNETSWIVNEETNSRFVLGKAIRHNFIGIVISSDGYIDKEDAIGFICNIVEKQVEAIRDAGF